MSEERRALPESCRSNHRLTDDNVYWSPDGRWRCRTCRRSYRPQAHDYRRLDFAPLDDASGSTLAERYRVSRRTIVRWRQDGIRIADAERCSDLLGMHPCELWNDWYPSQEAA